MRPHLSQFSCKDQNTAKVASSSWTLQRKLAETSTSTESQHTKMNQQFISLVKSSINLINPHLP